MQKQSADVSKAAPYRPPMSKSQKKQAVESLLGVRERLTHSKRGWKVTHYFLFATDHVEGTPSDRTHPYCLVWFPLDALPEFYWPEQRELVDASCERIGALVRDG